MEAEKLGLILVEIGWMQFAIFLVNNLGQSLLTQDQYPPIVEICNTDFKDNHYTAPGCKMGKTNLVPLYEREKIPRPKTVRQTGYGDGVGRCVVLRSLNNRALLFHGCSDPLPEFRPPPPQRGCINWVGEGVSHISAQTASSVHTLELLS